MLLATSALAQPAFAQPTTAVTLEEELASMRAELARMAARIETLEKELNAADAAPVVAAAVAAENASPTVEWKGAPQLNADNGWSFKPRGRINVDAGIVAAPDGTDVDDGFGSEARRIRLGVSGDIPGGFGYKVEADFAGDEVALTDAIVTYENDGLEVSIGQHNNFQSLEELSSSLHTSFIERAAFTDAFGFERRLGASLQYGTGDILLQGGVFTSNSADLPADDWSLDGRVVFAPKLGETQVHLGSSIHRRELESGSTVRYRQRPLVHFTDLRFINTGNLDADEEFGLGLEAALIRGPFHASAETFWQTVERPGDLSDPTFFGGSIEAGYFLTTGDSRGYKNGKFDRVKPANPVGEGGFGAVQFNARYDRLDLNDDGVVGGTQDSYQFALIWTTTDYARFLINYARLNYQDTVFPDADGDTSYGVDAIGVRAQVDF
ncbi:MAG: porin [Pontixanthobacter sp.]